MPVTSNIPSGSSTDNNISQSTVVKEIASPSPVGTSTCDTNPNL